MRTLPPLLALPLDPAVAFPLILATLAHTNLRPDRRPRRLAELAEQVTPEDLDKALDQLSEQWGVEL